LAIAQEILDDLQLHRIVIDERQRGVRAGEPVRPHLPVFGRRIVRRDERHVAIRALLRLGRIVERPRALTRDA
jgi:hypothetical protein